MTQEEAMKGLEVFFASLADAGPIDASIPGTAISSNGVNISYEVLGRNDPTIVLVHGWSNHRGFWHPHMETIARTHRVAALDLAGFGESGQGRKEWTMRNFGEDVAAVVRELPSERLVLVGFSMGGAVVLEATKLIPERIVGVVLVDTFHNPEGNYSASAVEDCISEWQATWHDPAAVRKLGFTPSTPDSLIQRYIQNTPVSVPPFWWEALRDFFRWRNADLLSALAQIQVPIYAINADHVPTETATFRKYVPNFEVGIMPEVGHLGVIWEKLELFDEFLLQAVARFSNDNH